MEVEGSGNSAHCVLREHRALHYVAGPLDLGAGLQDGDEDCDHRAGLGVGSPLLKDVGEVGPLSLGGELGPLRGWDRLGPDREHSVLDCLGCHSERKVYCVGDFDVTILIIAQVFLGVCVARLVCDCIPSRPFLKCTDLVVRLNKIKSCDTEE